MEIINKCTGTVAIPCNYDQKAVRPGSGLLLYVPISLCMPFTGTLLYWRPWSVRLSDEIFVAVIWFAIPVTAVPRVTDGIYMCSTFNRLEVNPLLWSLKFFFKTWNFLISSKDIYLGAQLPRKTGNDWAECKYTRIVCFFNSQLRRTEAMINCGVVEEAALVSWFVSVLMPHFPDYETSK